MPRAVPLALLALVLLLPGAAADDTGGSEATIFDTGNLAQNATGSWVADKVGTFVYHCHLHPSMTGRVVVTNGTAGMAVVVRIQDFRFQPENLTVPLGTNITWVNDDRSVHTATAATHEARLGVTHGQGAGANATDHGRTTGDAGHNGTSPHNGTDESKVGHGGDGAHGSARTSAPGFAAVVAVAGLAALLRRRER